MKEKPFFNALGLLLIVVFLFLSAYIYFEMGKESVKELEQEEPSKVETSIEPDIAVQEKKEVIESKEEPEIPPSETEPIPLPLPKENPCVQIEKDVAEFFTYLDTKKYILNLNPKTNAYAHFKKILKKLNANPPIPAEEISNPSNLLRNITHFFHALGKEDLYLIKEIITKEQDTNEIDFKMLFKWLLLEDDCADPEGLRPSLEVLCHYSGFFLNTIGGRSYLFRRAPNVRLLISYYCLLILHKADKEGENNYGLDIFPHIAPIKNEFENQPAFKFQMDYIEHLNRIESYYVEKRSL